ncbi:MAG TPA: alpha/beta hydrolase [Candidatus Dormibacteraeota bacterium]|nr:alpha/beta hydrolase [Candidatus Dormibacteraeota bacterium]
MALRSRYPSAAIEEAHRRLDELGDAFSPEVIAANFNIFAPLHERAPFSDVEITRDLRYGSDERHRLDVFRPKPADGVARPVLVFVHGGGFIGGDKTMPGAPFYDNVGAWGVRHGMIGVNVTYRLAPKHAWPAGSEDLGAALSWVRSKIASQGGDPARIYLMGQSAGGAHVAHFLAHQHFASADRQALAGAILVSGLYDTVTMDKNPMFKAYFGEDATRYAEQSALPGLAACSTPLLVLIAEHDPSDFKRQYVELMRAYLAARGTLPRFAYLPSHGHLSTILSVNTEDEFVGGRILDFVDTTTTAPVAVSA